MSAGSQPRAPGEPPEALLRALRKVLRALVRLLLANHVNYPYLAGMLKSAYVEVAEADFPVPGKPQTDSRISLLTGVHRKDVKRLRRSDTDQDPPPANVSLGAQLVATWIGSPELSDSEGGPRPLPRQSRDSTEMSFERLVQSVSKDIRPRAVLDEWLRLGVAHLDDQDLVWLNTAAFVPGKGFDEKAYYFGRNVHDHLAAAAHNLGGDGPPFLERSVYYDELSPESVAQLARMAETLGMDVLQKVNRRALELQRADAGRGPARERMNLGVYFYSATEREQERSGDE